MPTDSAPMVIAYGEAYTGGDKGIPQNAVAARKWFRVGVRLSAGQSLGASSLPGSLLNPKFTGSGNAAWRCRNFASC